MTTAPENTVLSDDSHSGNNSYVLTFGMPASDGRVRLGPDIEIFTNKPRPEFASYGCQAFEAHDRRSGQTLLVQLAPAYLTPRITNIGSYKNIKNTQLQRLYESGIVYWTPDDRQYFAFALDMPPDRKLMNSFADKPLLLSEDQVMSAMIRPLISVLSDLHSVDMIHGAVVPENIFFAGAENNQTAFLGECLTSAPFFRHHALYETIERAQAQPSGRGQGSIKNDLYSLGICVALAIRGENLLADKSVDEIIRLKMQNGSYTTVVGRERVPAMLGDFLRGVLNDDEAQRWGMEQVQQWLDGRHNTSKQSPALTKAARPFMFREEKVWDIRTLGMLFSQNVGEAIQIVEKDQFDLWIKRNFDDTVLQHRLNKAMDKTESVSKDRQINAIVSALDPQGPVRYKGLSLFPSGYGIALSDAIARGGDIQAYGELILFQIMTGWINLRFEDVLDATSLITNFEKCRNYLAQKMPGYGIERVIYILNREAICYSPAFAKFSVIGPGQLLLALEAISKASPKPENILDRHMIAFLSVREQKMIDPYLGHIVSKDRKSQILGTLQCLAAIQRRFRVGSVPGVGAWILGMLGPVLERFSDRDLRAEINKRISKFSDPGDLGAILELVDSPHVLQEDGQRFTFARQEYGALNREMMQLNERLQHKNVFGIDAGRQFAMLISVFFATFCILAFVGFYFTRS